MPTTVLIVEDDNSIRRGLIDALAYAGYATIECANGRDAVPLATEHEIDLVLLDVMLPGRTGFEILNDLRQAQPTLPVIMVTARGAESDRIQGLKNGADDYVVKPFSALELLARVEAVLRRSPERPNEVKRLRAGSVIIDLGRREASRPNAEPISLSDRESGILTHLARHHGRVVERDELLQRVWGLNPRGIHTRTVDMHIARLRRKLENGASGGPLIETVRGKGYRLGSHVEVDAEAAV